MEILFELELALTKETSEGRAADFDPPKQNICCPHFHPTASGFAVENTTQEGRFCL